MHALGIVGESAATAARRVADRLADRGSVATVTRLSDDPASSLRRGNGEGFGSHSSRTDVGLGAGSFRVSVAEGLTLEGTLADLAPDHDYSLVVDFPEADLPTVAVGGAEPAGPVVHEADSAADLDVDAVLEAVEATEPIVTLESLVAEAKRSDRSEFAGAIATFTGRVRAREDDADTPTEHLEFERYDEVAEQRLEEIRSDLEARTGVHEVLAYHKSGVVEAGEDIVFVVVLAGHREEAFETVSDGIDRLKAEVPLFKKEVTVDEEFWRHERESD